MADFYRQAFHVARKRHICDACGMPINPGQKYQEIAATWCGEFQSYKWCGDCCRVMDYFFRFLSDDNEYDYWVVMDSIYEAFCHDCPHGPSNNDDCPEDIDIWHCKYIQKKIAHEEQER